MKIRLFMLSNNVLICRADDQYSNVGAYAAWQTINKPDRILLAWEDGGRPSISDKPERYARCAEAIAAGNALHPHAKNELDDWAARMGMPTAGAVATLVTATIAAEVGPRKPPRTMIVQEWAKIVNREAPAEIGRRAWEATMAMCKGG